MGQSKAAPILSLVSFFGGVFIGYKLKGWRIQWLQRRRARLANKLADTQKEIEFLTKEDAKIFL